MATQVLDKKSFNYRSAMHCIKLETNFFYLTTRHETAHVHTRAYIMHTYNSPLVFRCIDLCSRYSTLGRIEISISRFIDFTVDSYKLRSVCIRISNRYNYIIRRVHRKPIITLTVGYRANRLIVKSTYIGYANCSLI